MEDSDTINVVVRVRPTIRREQNEGCNECWKVDGNNIYLVNDGPSTSHENCYAFDYIFDKDEKNADVYSAVRPIVQSAIDGINGTVFAYGQTSSGKTHSIMGDQNEKGIIPLAIDDIFNIIQNDNKRKYLLRSSYIEIYNDKINDLLNKDQTDLKIREDHSGTLSIANCVEEITRSSDELMEVVRKGNKNKQMFSTAMNDRSSRSHVIFKIVIESSPSDDVCGDEEIPVQVSQLYFVDLAGSERAAQTKATGARLKEGGHINKSLHILSRVIRQLGDNVSHINFRDSKLTRLLSNALGGNCKTLIIATVTPVSVDNTQSTLQFAQAAKKIKTKPRVNQVLTNEALIKQQKHKERKLLDQLQIERTINITLQVNQSVKDKKIKDLETQIKNIQLSYVRKDPVRVSSRRHTMGFERPTSSMYSKIPLLRISEEPRPSASLLTADPAPSDHCEETLDAVTTPDEMEVSEVESDSSTPKRVLRQRFIDLNESHAELKEFTKHEVDINTKHEMELLSKELDSEKAKRKEYEEKLTLKTELVEKLNVRTSELEISLEHFQSRCKNREAELLDLLGNYTPRDIQSQPMEVAAYIEPDMEYHKIHCEDRKMQCEDTKANKEFQFREDKLSLEAQLAMAREQNKLLLEENNEIKFRENLLKNKILGSPQKEIITSDDLSKIKKAELRKSISDSTIYLFDEPIMVRSSSSPNINDQSVGLTNSNEEIFEDLRKGFSSLQSILTANSVDSLTKSTRLEVSIEQNEYVTNLQSTNKDLENEIRALQQENDRLLKEHMAELNTINDAHSAQVMTYENTVKELSGYNKTMADQYSSQLTQASTQATIELNDGELKLTEANVTIGQLQEQLRILKEQLCTSEKNKTLELNKIQSNYSAQLTEMQQVITTKQEEGDKCTIEMEMLQQALTKYEAEISILKINISNQNDYSLEKYKQYETILNDKQNTLTMTQNEVILKMNHIEELEANMCTLQAELEVKKKESSEVTLEVKRLEGQLKSNQSHLDAADGLYEAMQLQLQQENRTLTYQLECAKKERDEAFKETNRLQELYQMTMDNLTAASDYSNNIQLESNKEIDLLKAENDEAVEGKKQLVLELKALKQQQEQINAASDEQLQTLREALNAKEKEITELRHSLTERDELLEENKQAMIQEYKQKVDALEEDSKRQEAAVALRDNQVRNLTTSLKNSTDEAIILKNKLADNIKNTDDLLNEGSKQIQQLEEEIQKKQRELNKLEKLYETLNNSHLAEVKSLEDKIRQVSNESKDVAKCNCAVDIRKLEDKLNSIRNKLVESERKNDELDKNYNSLNESHNIDLVDKNKEIAVLSGQIVEYQRSLADSRTELKDARIEIEDLKEVYELQVRELKSSHKKKESEFQACNNEKLIREHSQQIDAFEKKLRSVNSINDRLMLESTEQVKQLENEIKNLQEKLSNAHNERAKQIDNVRAMHSEEMRALMQANEQKDSQKIEQLRQAYENTLESQKDEIKALQKNLKVQLANYESELRKQTSSEKRLTNALNVAEEKLKNLRIQLETLKTSHANEIKELNIENDRIEEKYIQNQSIAKNYSKNTKALEARISDLELQMSTSDKNRATVTASYMAHLTKMNVDHDKDLQSLNVIINRRSEECKEVQAILEKEQLETAKLKQELNNASTLIKKLSSANDDQNKQKEDTDCRIHILNTTITNIRAINEQNKRTIKTLEMDLATKCAALKEIKKQKDTLEVKIKEMEEEKEASDSEIAADDLPEASGQEKAIPVSPDTLEVVGCASCKETIDQLKTMLYKTTTHNSKLIDNCYRLKSKNQSLQGKINDLRKALEKTRNFVDATRKNLDLERDKSRKLAEQCSVSNSDVQMLKAKLEVEYANVEKLNKKIVELHTAQKMYRTHLKEQTVESRFDEANSSKAFQEAVKERRQSIHDQRRNIDACEKCQQRRSEISEYEKTNRNLIKINQMLNDQHKILESKLRGEEDSDALELQAQFNCTEILLRNLNRCITKGYDTCEYCTSLLNFTNKKVLALSKISENNAFWYSKTETDSQTIDEVLKVVDRFRPRIDNEMVDESLNCLDNVKMKLEAAKLVLYNKRSYIENFLGALKTDVNILQPLLSCPPDKRCFFYDTNKNVVELFVSVIERLTTSLQYLDETRTEEKEKTRFRIMQMDEQILNTVDKFVHDMPCSVNIMNYNQLALKYVSLKALIRMRVDKEKLREFQDYIPMDDSRQRIAEQIKVDVAAATGYSYSQSGTSQAPSTIVCAAQSARTTSSSFAFGKSVFKFDTPSTSRALAPTSNDPPSLVLRTKDAGGSKSVASRSNSRKSKSSHFKSDKENKE